MEIDMKPLLAVAALAFVATPAIAQDDGGELPDDVQTAIVYGDDAAPDCPDGMICVVARLPENDRYRIPETLRFSTDPENTAWSKRVESLELIGNFGALSCSTAGAGGFTGCTQDLIRRAYGEKKTSEAVRFSDLIAAAREERLAEIDENAADEQARVEQIEREYMERLEKERASELPDEGVDDLPQPADQTGPDEG
jgi:hypothetical protein